MGECITALIVKDLTSFVIIWIVIMLVLYIGDTSINYVKEVIKIREILKGYKVVNHHLASINGRYKIDYDIKIRENLRRVWNYPRLGDGALAVFDTLDNAVRFWEAVSLTARIFECEYEVETNEKKKALYLKEFINIFTTPTAIHLSSYCTQPFNEKTMELFDKISYPSGTVFARRVRIGKEIEEKELQKHLENLITEGRLIAV